MPHTHTRTRTHAHARILKSKGDTDKREYTDRTQMHWASIKPRSEASACYRRHSSCLVSLDVLVSGGGRGDKATLLPLGFNKFYLQTNKQTKQTQSEPAASLFLHGGHERAGASAAVDSDSRPAAPSSPWVWSRSHPSIRLFHLRRYLQDSASRAKEEQQGGGASHLIALWSRLVQCAGLSSAPAQTQAAASTPTEGCVLMGLFCGNEPSPKSTV